MVLLKHKIPGGTTKALGFKGVWSHLEETTEPTHLVDSGCSHVKISYVTDIILIIIHRKLGHFMYRIKHLKDRRHLGHLGYHRHLGHHMHLGTVGMCGKYKHLGHLGHIKHFRHLGHLDTYSAQMCKVPEVTNVPEVPLEHLGHMVHYTGTYIVTIVLTMHILSFLHEALTMTTADYTHRDMLPNHECRNYAVPFKYKFCSNVAARYQKHMYSSHNQ